MKNIIKNVFVMCATGAGAIIGFLASGLTTGTITVESNHKDTKNDVKESE